MSVRKKGARAERYGMRNARSCAERGHRHYPAKIEIPKMKLNKKSHEKGDLRTAEKRGWGPGGGG